MKHWDMPCVEQSLFFFQEVANKLAKLAVRACARLGGYLTGDLETPNNSVTQEILNRLLTPYLARQLSLDKPEEVSQARI
jgi:DnaJ family protein C protein 13